MVEDKLWIDLQTKSIGGSCQARDFKAQIERLKQATKPVKQ